MPSSVALSSTMFTHHMTDITCKLHKTGCFFKKTAKLHSRNLEYAEMFLKIDAWILHGCYL